ncbi:hypothetical protein RI367_006047 [Sorochytrium milnesiophthora]
MHRHSVAATALLLVLLSVVFPGANGDLRNVNSLRLEHRTDASEYSLRGVIDVRDGAISPSVSSAASASSLQVTPEQTYFIRLRVPSSDSSPERTIVKSIPGAMLCPTTKNDRLIVHVDAQGDVLSFDYAPGRVGECRASTRTRTLDPAQLRTTVQVTTPAGIPLPTVADPTKPVRSTKAEAKVKQEENKSFIQKYWMYIVPFLLAMMIPGGKDEPQPGGAAAAAATGAGAAATGAGAAAAVAAGGARAATGNRASKRS